MIEKLEIAGVHMAVGDDLKKYVLSKIGRLDKYIPKHARKSAHAEVKLKEVKLKTRLEHVCEVILYLPSEKLNIKETAETAFAAVDVVEDKLKTLLRKYKELHADPKLRQRLFEKIRRGPSPEA